MYSPSPQIPDIQIPTWKPKFTEMARFKEKPKITSI